MDTEKGTTWLKNQCIIPEPGVKRGHPFAVGLTSKEHGLGSGLKAAQHRKVIGFNPTVAYTTARSRWH